MANLPAGESALALAAGGRRVVLKRLDPDCLLRSGPKPKLHPSIRDRLARVRELAHARVANLYGVEHDQGVTYLVWEYVEGQTLADWAAGERRPSPRELLLTARELILTIEALHARGIVHGAIHGHNVIVDPQGRLKLTHVSPLLYSEPRRDMDSIADLFSDIAQRRGEAESPLERLAQEVHEPQATLRSMGARASSLIELRRDEATDEQERRGDAHRRRRSRLAAAAVVLAALGLSWEIRHSVRRLTPPPPSPPQAPPAAME
jgi:serine/threonine protein kinase